MDSTKAYNLLYFHFYKGLLGYKELAEKDLWLKGGVRKNFFLFIEKLKDVVVQSDIQGISDDKGRPHRTSYLNLNGKRDNNQ